MSEYTKVSIDVTDEERTALKELFGVRMSVMLPPEEIEQEETPLPVEETTAPVAGPGSPDAEQGEVDQNKVNGPRPGESVLAYIFRRTSEGWDGGKKHTNKGPDPDDPNYIPPRVITKPGSIITRRIGAGIKPKPFVPRFENKVTKTHFRTLTRSSDWGTTRGYGLYVHANDALHSRGPWNVRIVFDGKEVAKVDKMVGMGGGELPKFRVEEDQVGKTGTVYVSDSWGNRLEVAFTAVGVGLYNLHFADGYYRYLKFQFVAD